LNSIPAMPQKVFMLGNVRVALWQRPDVGSEANSSQLYRLTLERKQFNIRGYAEFTSVLDPEDIPVAILVLKQAHTWIQSPPGARSELDSSFDSADVRLTERTP